MITDGMDPEEPNVRLMHQRYCGLTIRWREFPFDWIRPNRFGVARKYLNGPIESLRMLAYLEPIPSGGTHFQYDVWILPRNILGWLMTMLYSGLINRRNFERIFLRYDNLLTDERGKFPLPITSSKAVSRRQSRRILEIGNTLEGIQGLPSHLVRRLTDLVAKADDFTLIRIRPYAIADVWNASRSIILELFLHATRQGLLKFSWEVLCPLCRGAKEKASRLEVLKTDVHCDSCNISFRANFDQSVELVFSPNPAVHNLEFHEFCVGGPQVTPHIIAKKTVGSGESYLWQLQIEPGRYRLRVEQKLGGLLIGASSQGQASIEIVHSSDPWPEGEVTLHPTCEITLRNSTEFNELFLLERMVWMDDAVTAAEVTARQTFRDLFSSEALRQGEQISVGTLMLAFTDLRGSTRLYEDIGDAPAFGLVMSHFDVLKACVRKYEGALIKTMGDAIMAAFIEPVNALKALLEAQRKLAQESGHRRPLALKVGINTGPCIAITQDERLDYFGTTVNLTARLECLSQGDDIVVSASFAKDPAIESYLQENKEKFHIERDSSRVKGITGGPVAFLRIKQPLPTGC